jgi:hypothetical protein
MKFTEEAVLNRLWDLEKKRAAAKEKTPTGSKRGRPKKPPGEYEPISPLTCNIILYLLCHPEDRQSQIARHFHVSRQRVSQIVHSMRCQSGKGSNCSAENDGHTDSNRSVTSSSRVSDQQYDKSL